MVRASDADLRCRRLQYKRLGSMLHRFRQAVAAERSDRRRLASRQLSDLLRHETSGQSPVPAMPGTPLDDPSERDARVDCLLRDRDNTVVDRVDNLVYLIAVSFDVLSKSRLCCRCLKIPFIPKLFNSVRTRSLKMP